MCQGVVHRKGFETMAELDLNVYSIARAEICNIVIPYERDRPAYLSCPVCFRCGPRRLFCGACWEQIVPIKVPGHEALPDLRIFNPYFLAQFCQPWNRASRELMVFCALWTEGSDCREGCEVLKMKNVRGAAPAVDDPRGERALDILKKIVRNQWEEIRGDDADYLDAWERRVVLEPVVEESCTKVRARGDAADPNPRAQRVARA